MDHKRITKLVFSGGGINGLCFLGCVRALEEHKILADIECFLGTSAGSMISLLLNIGYSSIELIEIISNIDMELIKDITSDNVFSYFTHFGIDSGNKFMKVFEILIKNKGISTSVTFQELFDLTHKHLIITGTNLSYKRADFFDYKEFPNMEVLQALRISMSIPFVFTKPTFNECTYVDGSIMANYPIYYFESTNNILGFLITEEYAFEEITSIDTFTMSLINSLLKKAVLGLFGESGLFLLFF